MPNVTVNKSGGKISVSHPTVTVSVKAGDKVTWNSDDGHFNIKFKPGEWDSPETNSLGGKHVAECGPFHTPGRTLKYTVTASGHDDLDPDVVIEP